MRPQTVKFASKLISQIFVGLLICYLLVANFTPFGASAQLSSQDLRQISKLGPASRVTYVSQDGQQVAQQSDDLIYFNSFMPYLYDQATLKVNFENPYPNQELQVGFSDKPTWHYNNQLLDSSMIDSLNWNKSGNGPYLYQRTKKYDTIDNFIRQPPVNDVVGVYDLDPKVFIDDKTVLPKYTPSDIPTVIDTPMRGSETIYAYVSGEPFHLQVQKQDLNWYADPDVMTIRIYKGDTVVYQADIQDDGVTDGSKKAGPIQSATIDNPGPDLPEPGIYRIQISASNDVLVRKIITNLHKLVWQGPIYLASNAQSYPSVLQTTPDVLYTSSLVMDAKVSHQNALQTMQVGDQKIDVNNLNQDFYANTPGNVQITVPKSDIVLNGSGFFVFARDQFFYPTRLNTLQITDPSDLDRVDYLLTNYEQAKVEPDGSRTAVLSFDLSTARLANSQLSWDILASGLKDNNRTIVIRKIELIMSKKGWFE